MQGFKSFNKKISVPLLPGFNCITGPNGSGKSNILDAIAFVLGRTSAKSMRADRLNELIYHGSQARGAADYTAVTIYFNNEKKSFPSDEPEVYITRKVNKDGVSVFKLNGKTVNKENVLEYLSAARIHPEGPNIIQQGDVIQIVETSSKERRFIIDEISGIAEYTDKKDKAMKDLDAVDGKLHEAEIIVNERYDILKRLENESSAAAKYQTLQKRLLIMKASLAKKRFDVSDANYKKLTENISKAESDVNAMNKDIENTEKNISNSETDLRKIADELMHISRSMEKDREASELRTKLLINKDKLSSNAREVERLDDIVRRLQIMESRGAEFSGSLPNSVRTVLDAKIKGVHGIVANLIKGDKRYQTAIEIAAGSHLYNLVVENDEVAKTCIDFLKREKIGRATFLPLNKIKHTRLEERDLLKKKGVIGLASELVTFDRKYAPAIDFVFGSTVIIDTLDTAQGVGIGKVRMVTTEGDLVEKSGAMVGGYLIKHGERQSKQEDNISDYIEMRDKLKQDVERLNKEITTLENSLKKYSDSKEIKGLSELEKRRIDLESQIDTLTERRRILYEKKLNMQAELNKYNIQKARVEADLESAKIEVQQYGQVEYVDEKISVLESQVKKTFDELNSIGAVNFKAIEEFDKFKAEFDVYKVKYEKILEEKNAVVGMINEIELRRKEVFYKCMNELSKYLNEVFNKMTGGTANLSLENPEDLESGLLIEASPFGKKLINIDSLSGGEKSLVAMSFIFAIQRYKPSPFYILDEIDAALDKENSEKIARFVRDFAKEAQFLIISHNDTTLKYADRLFGVTMIDGETKLVGLELPEK